MKFTGERAITRSFLGEKRFGDHLVRYNFALPLCRNKKVLDLACGSGYGTFIISKVAKGVIGGDVSKETVDFCKKNIKMTILVLWLLMEQT